MARTYSQASLLKKRVRKVQAKAKFVGVFYLLGTIGLLAIVATLPLLTGTCIVPNETQFPVLTFYQPLVDLFSGGMDAFASLTADAIVNVIVVALFAITLLVMAINVLRSIGKLGWLFKRRASYVNGFNRNMYAMDDMAKFYSRSLATLITLHTFIFLLSGGKISLDGTERAVQLTTNAYVALGVGLGLHFFCGLIGGKVTLFTTGERMEEEERESGLFVFFVRNLVQFIAVAGIAFFLLQESVFLEKTHALLKALVEDKTPFAEIDWLAYVAFGVEFIGWLFIGVLVGHATADTEFNREGTVGAGMRVFAVFAFLTALVLGARVTLPLLEIGTTEGALNQNLLTATVIAFVAFLVDCILKPGLRDEDYDDEEMETYFRDGNNKYNNTII